MLADTSQGRSLNQTGDSRNDLRGSLREYAVSMLVELKELASSAGDTELHEALKLALLKLKTGA